MGGSDFSPVGGAASMLTIPPNLIQQAQPGDSRSSVRPSDTDLLMAAAEMHRQGAFEPKKAKP